MPDEEFSPYPTDCVRIEMNDEPVTKTVYSVPLKLTPHPTAELFATIADHLRRDGSGTVTEHLNGEVTKPRVLAVLVTQELSEGEPILVGTLLTSAPVGMPAAPENIIEIPDDLSGLDG